ncbi:unnamed protein product [Tilletia controversa]|uniref:Major facilitator superfamily (MFS) profile domain-containing protein n=1 Tax=Tilletia controversa TaxID=13291 RepID=A0A8X7SZ85_9BASI|nr:hypothetical protein CF328_g1275 [Tilletia controversa]KAE8252752.1 hypothetical protein A4X06_0g1956 [Tilletia controversa]CAD6907139.1 unnamed protein product [Tilletia controversa]CAD6908686.1 unnamed protein product [Tilletia controversa]
MSVAGSSRAEPVSETYEYAGQGSSHHHASFFSSGRGDADVDDGADWHQEQQDEGAPKPPLSWRDPRVGHASHSRLERTIEAIGMGRYQLHLLLLTGMGWAADNAWMTAIPMVLPAVQAHFNVSDRYSGTMSSACFLGMMIGSLVWGSYSDTYGRLPSFTYTLAITTIFAIVLPLSPSFPFLCFSLFLLGSGLGGSMPTDGTIFLENTPKSKQYLTVALSTFFSAGAALSSAWAIIVMPCRVSVSPGDDAGDACKGSLRWRIYLAGLAVLTAAFFLSRIFLFTLHESPRYLVSQGRTAEARRVLQQIVEYNDTTEGEALESIARSAEPGASALSTPTPDSDGLVDRFTTSARLFITGNGPRRLNGDITPQSDDRHTVDSGKNVSSRESASSDSPVEEDAENGNIETGNRARSSIARPQRLNRGMSVRLSDVRSWSSNATGAPSKRASERGRLRDLPMEWQAAQSELQEDDEQRRSVGVDRASGDRGRPSIAGSDFTASGQSMFRQPSSSPTKMEQREGEREGLLSSRTSNEMGKAYLDDSIHPEDDLNGRPSTSYEALDADLASSTAPTKPATIQERMDQLLSLRWRRTTLLTWSIWTSLNLGYTMLNVFLPKILEERAAAGGGGRHAAPPSTQSQSSDAEALWSYFAYALASIPGPLIAAYLVEMPWLGRKGTLALSLSCTSGLMLLLSSVLNSDSSSSSSNATQGEGGGGNGTTFILVLISFGATTAYAALYGYTPELFAIELRGTACGVASAAGRLAGVLAPMIGGWLLGRTETGTGASGSSHKGSGAGALCGLSAGLLAVTVLLTLGLPREEVRGEGGAAERRRPRTEEA